MAGDKEEEVFEEGRVELHACGEEKESRWEMVGSKEG